MCKPKRILIIGLTERMGGVETFIYNTTIFSDKKNYVYDYLIHGADHCVFQKEINDFYNDGEQHIYFIRKYKENPLGCIADLRSFYRRNGKKYDYIHFQSGSTAEILYVWPFCKKYKIPVISHSHNGSGYNPTVNSFFRSLVNHVSYKRLACSKVAAEWLFGKKHVNDTQIVINGIDTDRFTYNSEAHDKIRKQYGISENQFVVGHIGRFSEQKNHTFILDIFGEILKKKSNAVLLLVGIGELMEQIRNKVQEMGIESSVIFAGKQAKTEDYYSAFDCFLMPSLYEGLPIVGIEAQCEGLDCYFSDQIDKQIMISNKAHMLPLNKNAKMWANTLMSNIDNLSDRISDMHKIYVGYSIHNTVSELQKVYGVGDP